LGKLDRHTEAAADWAYAVGYAADAERPNLRRQQARSLARAAQAAQVLELTAQLSQSKDGADLCDLAAICGVAVATTDDPKLREACAVRAIELLKAAQAVSYFADPARLPALRKDGDFAALRDRADFRQWLRALAPDA
jgi:hypothetical protein